MDDVSASLNLTRCSVCYRQSMRKGVHVRVQSYPVFNPPTSVIALHSNDQDDILCLAQSEPDPILSAARRLAHDPEVLKQVPPVKVASAPPNAPAIYRDSDPPRPSPGRIAIDRTPDTLFCSDQCCFADRGSCHSAIDIEYDSISSTSRLPLTPPNSLVTHGSQDDSNHLSLKSSESRSSAPSPSTDYALNAYSRLSAIYNFDPLPQLPPKVKTSSQEPPPPLEGGIIMAARRIQAALCIDKHTKSSWGLPIYSLDSEEDNKPIPGWTDGSNAWRASVYGLAPPRDFTRTDPDDAAIRAYGSYVATPHRSRGVQSAHHTKGPAAEAQPTSSSSLPPSIVDVDPSTQELYRQYCACFTRRSQSRTPIHVRGARFSTSSTGSSLLSPPREVPLLKPGAEGRLLVPDVKMRPGNSFSGAGVTSGKTNILLMDAPQCTRRRRKGSADRNASHTQSYKSESLTYPIMRSTPKKEIRIERRVVDGVEQDVEIEVLIEQPIKRLFLFGGARD